MARLNTEEIWSQIYFQQDLMLSLLSAFFINNNISFKKFIEDTVFIHIYPNRMAIIKIKYNCWCVSTGIVLD